MLEMEIKAALGQQPIEERLLALGFALQRIVEEKDTYFCGVDRDFAKTDEALRLRSCRVLPDGPAETLVTYKGPKAPGVIKSRTEHETAVASGQTMACLLEALGCHPLRRVEKIRTEYTKGAVTACLDTVIGLGRFLELEILMEEEQAQAAEVLLDLLDSLGVPRESLTRQSYLEMLLKR